MRIITITSKTNKCSFLQLFVKKILTFTFCSLAVTSLLVLPLSFSTEDFSIQSTQAFAKDGGGGKGGGGGGGKGGGGGGGGQGKGGGNSGDKGGKANGNSGSKGEGGSIGKGLSKGFESVKEAVSSLLGRLNAAHSSSTAREHAAEDSAVGQIADYERAVESGDDEAAKEALDRASNKPTDDPAVEQSVNDLLGISDQESEDQAQ